MSVTADALWREFLGSGTEQASEAAGADYTSWAFGDSPDLADRLLDCVLKGEKRATCGSLDAYNARGEAVPVVGEYSVVCDGSGSARCVLRTTEIRVVPFEEVDAHFAADEGEGDRSLKSWREGHAAYFERELERLGLHASPTMPLVCERFALLYVGPKVG